MDINDVISKLKAQFGNSLDVNKVKEMFKGQDLSNFSMADIIARVKSGGAILGDLDGDGKVESPWEEIKGKASSMFGGLFGKKK